MRQVDGPKGALAERAVMRYSKRVSPGVSGMLVVSVIGPMFLTAALTGPAQLVFAVPCEGLSIPGSVKWAMRGALQVSTFAGIVRLCGWCPGCRSGLVRPVGQ